MRVMLGSILLGRTPLRLTWLRLLFGGFVLAAAQSRADIASLKRLSFEELLVMEVTSVSRTPEKLSDTASAIQVLSAEDIRRSGATNLPETLRLANNLNVAQKNAHDWGISSRGFNTDLANKLLVMFDGRTIYTPLFSGVRWDVQDYLLEDVDRIEVISGPGGAVWGANAVNGVINVISKTAQDTQGYYAAAAAGTQLRQSFAARYGAKLAPNVYYRVYGKHIERDDESLANGNSANDARWLTQFGFRLDAARDRDGLTVQGDYYEGKDGFTTGGKASVDGGNLLGRWTRALTDESDFRVQVYYDHTYLRQPVARFAAAPPGFFEDDLDTFDLDFQHRFVPITGVRLIWGAGYRTLSDHGKPAPALAFTPADWQQELFSAFGQVEIAFNHGATFIVGSKVEHNDYTGFEFEPNVRFQVKPDKGSTVWAAVSRAVRSPSRVDRDILQPATAPVILRGDSRFISETVIACELGYRRQIHNRLAVSAATFYNVYDHIRSVSRTPVTNFPFYFANDLEGDTYGAEVTANLQPAPSWRMFAGYTLLKSDIRIRPGGSDLNNALNELSDPQQQVSLRSSFDVSKDVDLDASLRWVDTLRNNNNGREGTVPSYAELDVRIAWRINEYLELALVGQNLLDRHHPEFGVPTPTRVELNRGFFAKVTWRY